MKHKPKSRKRYDYDEMTVEAILDKCEHLTKITGPLHYLHTAG
ncbi:hypothetical protein HMPREF9103_00630 [Lentilactobacillus parafarraginis F0439]|uniref:Uncharacterized protein n=1 Tax=Lentilactobacillus parafarraginis F0439 TaxID=797515 RepID=G9ZLN2_9LACO|nr:hypothetical protein [Lentilactobacillus parafarraginis]EHM00262.1 hypothetical protein HMPREF9103_00630 [Lentilactobacillus parafarraginis F0439]